MPAQVPELKVMDEDRLIEDVLDKFVTCHEQTYEEFLSTFTHLSNDNVTRRGAFGTNSSENNFTSIKLTQRNERNDHRLSDKAIFLRTSSQCSEEELIVMDEGQKVGSFFQGDLNQAGKVKVDNFFDLEDLDVDEEIEPPMSKDLLLLPGEVEQDVSTSVPSYVPSMAQPLIPGVKPRPTGKEANKEREEIVGDEVQPFSLDEDFDYDTVMLTPKFTPTEIDAIKELSKQKRKSADLEEACD
ncbi:intraflagellar transport-associated protein [Hippopotamus amphibius kiboko]|uniref:intraflagellar transport-associated protein n=1 Tax=Hippopotamus amphibius kiboko TaxID=575201 RepID=UPI0025971AE9|nr:intraflagellar transport-associated protein [Hippopotamus amphibius kiboko]XP_057551370.1 intraflagellar transport-associated protein [Hippopotamus amphibius kiboko]XP_057551371.1 intraflagellar transport-associated protein [Hippopotamus amphibius kiboko]